MYKGKRIAVVIPAFNEAKYIADVLTGIPPFVDRVYVVNDASTDGTYEIASAIASKNGRFTVINRDKNGGVGATILSGHKEAIKDNMDIVAVMGGDGQMDPAILDKIIDPVAEGKADYAKGDRLSNPKHRKEMSSWRMLGNSLLTQLTRIASGYWNISDPQNGYTAISIKTLQKLSLENIREDFAFENDMLVKLKLVGARVVDVQHPAIYRGNGSKIKYHSFIVKTSLLLLKDFLWRLSIQYIKTPFSKLLGRKEA